MKLRFFSALPLFPLAVHLAAGAAASPASTAFTYQGRLASGSAPANGKYDLKFELFDAQFGGDQIGPAQTNITVSVANGLFTVNLDFGLSAFTGNGNASWLELGVRTNGNGAFTLLSPRQPLTPAPYALSAANLSGPVPAAQITGMLGSAQLGGFYAAALSLSNAANYFLGTFHGSGKGLTNVNAHKLAGYDFCSLPCYWNIGGNSGTKPDVNFLGTTDNQPLEFRVGGSPALRLVPGVAGPNLIGGWKSNFVGSGAVAASIVGGGASSAQILQPSCDLLTLTNLPNRIEAAAYEKNVGGTIGGGIGNVLGAQSSLGVIGGGARNNIGQIYPGDNEPGCIGGTIAGGMNNVIGYTSFFSTPGFFQTISGGEANLLRSDSHCTIGGGYANSMYERADFATIAGGELNCIDGDHASTIGGGERNTIAWYGAGSTIAGGVNNNIGSFFSSANSCAIGGGSGNNIEGSAANCCIGGGFQNSLQSPDPYGIGLIAATIAGGLSNSVAAYADYSSVGGGANNNVQPECPYATISGGLSNSITGPLATVPGGQENLAADYAFAAGYKAKAVHPGAFVWAAGNSNNFCSTASNRFQIYAAGGVRIDYGGQTNNGAGVKWLTLASCEPGKAISACNGAYLSESGVWTDNSDRRSKENFQPLDGKEILERLANLPVSKWNYSSDPASVQHIGPVAQDFYSSFGLGPDDTHLATLDSSGVALAAIQGLNQVVKEKDAEIQDLRKSVEELKAVVNKLAQSASGGR